MTENTYWAYSSRVRQGVSVSSRKISLLASTLPLKGVEKNRQTFIKNNDIKHKSLCNG